MSRHVLDDATARWLLDASLSIHMMVDVPRRSTAVRTWRSSSWNAADLEFPSNVTAYDPVYVALAEAIDPPILTCDALPLELHY